MTQLPFRQVDVFGLDPFTGNPVAVVLDADALTAEQMRRISVWTNLSECTFVLRPTLPGVDYRVRIFSLSRELPFAGHPTLGTVRAWLDAGGAPAHERVVVQECGVGPVDVRVDGDRLGFAAPPLIREGPVDEALLDEVVDVLGLARTDVVDAQWVDNGPGWIGVLLGSAEQVLALEPDASRRPGAWDIGVVGPHPPGSDTATEVRAFFTDGSAPLREDPVTGSLNASLAQWLLGSGRLSAPYTARQGTRLGRHGRVQVSRDAAADGQVWVGGRTHVAVSGSIEID